MIYFKAIKELSWPDLFRNVASSQLRDAAGHSKTETAKSVGLISKTVGQTENKARQSYQLRCKTTYLGIFPQYVMQSVRLTILHLWRPAMIVDSSFIALCPFLALVMWRRAQAPLTLRKD